MTSDGLLKLLLKTLVYREGGVNSSFCRGMTVGTELNSCHRGLGGGVLVRIGQMVMLMKKYWYLKVTKDNQSLTGEFVLVCLK